MNVVVVLAVGSGCAVSWLLATGVWVRVIREEEDWPDSFVYPIAATFGLFWPLLVVLMVLYGVGWVASRLVPGGRR